MASDVLTVCFSLKPTVKTISISFPSVRDHFSFFSQTYILNECVDNLESQLLNINESVGVGNITMGIFPSSIFAGLLGQLNKKQASSMQLMNSLVLC